MREQPLVKMLNKGQMGIRFFGLQTNFLANFSKKAYF